jgi:hypothetical protein
MSCPSPSMHEMRDSITLSHHFEFMPLAFNMLCVWCFIAVNSRYGASLPHALAEAVVFLHSDKRSILRLASFYVQVIHTFLFKPANAFVSLLTVIVCFVLFITLIPIFVFVFFITLTCVFIVLDLILRQTSVIIYPGEYYSYLHYPSFHHKLHERRFAVSRVCLWELRRIL